MIGASPLRLHVVAFGCQMSAADGAEMASPMLSGGFSWAASPEEADAVLLSTCTVRQHAEDRAMSLIGRLASWKAEDPKRLLIVAGCAAERLQGWIQRRFPHVDLVVGAKSIEQFPAVVSAALAERFDGVREADAFASAQREGFRPTGSAATDFVTIMRGCNYSCSYCIVPSVRGRELYRPAELVLEEARRKLDGGTRELTLLGQTVNSWSGALEGRPLSFAGLLRSLDRLPGLARLRFMSPHPYYADQEMLDAMAGCPSACELLHLPAQSGSDRVLKRMRRNYTRGGFLRLAEQARRRLPGVVFSTDIIVGFPGETEANFQETLSLIETLQPASAYCFKYSPRAGTESSAWEDDVPPAEKEERLARLNDVVDRLTRRALAERIGRSLEVLVEQPGFGRTRDGFKVRWSPEDGTAGELAAVRAVSASRRTLLGERETS